MRTGGAKRIERQSRNCDERRLTTLRSSAYELEMTATDFATLARSRRHTATVRRPSEPAGWPSGECSDCREALL